MTVERNAAWLSHPLSRIIYPILYIHITVRVGTPGNLLAHTLSNQLEIALMVRVANFNGAGQARLTSCNTTRCKALSSRVQRTIPDRVVTAGIIQMLEHQDEVDTVVLAAGFEEQNIELKSSFLPRLRRLSAPPAAVARFASGRPLEDIHMLKSDPTALAQPDIPVLTSAIIPLVRLRLMAPHLSGLTWGSSLEDSSACSIREITVVQDRIWGMHRPKVFTFAPPFPGEPVLINAHTGGATGGHTWFGSCSRQIPAAASNGCGVDSVE
ncbi:hypothetical protein C8J57DRAFT_1250849 [Mycena rebaudengoi]|nr:hypothetical protein C8J57DRAFT_1250849 [Mycena rebaudengoi]